jgi:hypothetical protein
VSSATTQQPIENYGVIGGLRSLTLAGMDGSIDILGAPPMHKGDTSVAQCVNGKFSACNALSKLG